MVAFIERYNKRRPTLLRALVGILLSSILLVRQVHVDGKQIVSAHHFKLQVPQKTIVFHMFSTGYLFHANFIIFSCKFCMTNMNIFIA